MTVLIATNALIIAHASASIAKQEPIQTPVAVRRIAVSGFREDVITVAFEGEMNAMYIHPMINTDATEIPAPKKAIHIDLEKQMMVLLEGNAPVRLFSISSGKARTPTPVGTFQVYRKQDLRISSQGVPYRMPQYLAFTKNQAFGMHALPYLGSSPDASNYWQEALDHIGIPVSHGCVRLLPDDATALYAWAEVGTPVIISKTSPYREFFLTVLQQENAADSISDTPL